MGMLAAFVWLLLSPLRSLRDPPAPLDVPDVVVAQEPGAPEAAIPPKRARSPRR